MRALIWISYSADTYSGWGCECGQAFMPSYLLCAECELSAAVLDFYRQGGIDTALRTEGIEPMNFSSPLPDLRDKSEIQVDAP